MGSRALRLLPALLAAGLLLLLAAGEATGNTFTVTTTADSGIGSLRQAISDANGTAGADTITIPAGTYNLLSALPEIDDPVTIVGAGSSDTVLNFSAAAGSEGFTIDGVAFGISNLEILHAATTGIDAAAGGTTALTGVSILNSGDAGVTAADPLVVTGSAIENSVNDGIVAEDTLEVDTSFVESNGSSGIDAAGSAASLTSDTIESNTADGVISTAPLTITSSIISNNSFKDVDARGQTVLDNDTITNSGTTGVVFSDNSDVTGSTFSGNGGAGILSSGGTLSVSNSTVAANAQGGIVGDSGTVTLLNDTIVGNDAVDGLSGPAHFDVANTIVSGNDPVDCSAHETTLANDLESGTSCGFTAAGDLQNTDPQLAGLADNGGPTQTEAIPSTSPAVDAGDDSTCLSTDQRGTTRPQGPHCDIGAYELVQSGGGGTTADAARSTVSASPTNVSTGSASSTITVTLRDGSSNPVSGKTVTLSAGSGSSTITTVSGTTNSSGVATFTVKDSNAETVAYTAHDTTDSIAVTQTASVTFTQTTTTSSGSGTTVTQTTPSYKSIIASLTPGTPSASFTVSPNTGITQGSLVQFTSTSTDATSPILSTEWSFGDGDTAAGAAPVHGYAQTGSYTVTLTVRDLTGAVATSSQTVTVGSGSVFRADPSVVAANGTMRAALTIEVPYCYCPAEGVVVQPKNGSSSLIDDTGKVRYVIAEQIPDGGNYVVFYATDTTPETVTYTLTYAGGNTFGQCAVEVTFVPAAAGVRSNVTVSPSSQPANGKARATVTATLRNANGAPLSGKQVTLLPLIATGPHAGSAAHVGTPTATTNAAGVAKFAVPDAWPENVLMEATDTSDGITIAPRTGAARAAAIVRFTQALLPAASRSRAVASPTIADVGTGTGPTVHVQLLNGAGGAVPGRTVSLAPSSGNAHVTPASAVTDANGEAQFTVSDPTAETVTFVATDDTDKISVGQTPKVEFVDHVADLTLSTITNDRSQRLADQVDTGHVTVHVLDSAGQPISLDPVTLHSSTGAADIQQKTVVTDQNGNATFVITGSEPDAATFTARIWRNGSYAALPEQTTITFVAPVPKSASMNIPIEYFGGEGATSATFDITVYDAAGAPMGGVPIALLTGGGMSQSVITQQDFDDGLARHLTPGVTNYQGMATLTIGATGFDCGVDYTTNPPGSFMSYVLIWQEPGATAWPIIGTLGGGCGLED
ncbi:MAG TPA: Ig-like domain-containing protein [Gaiellaceae bacterium]|nr:Ig-like domain-containing protein [Gaiellaceae bacterium]